MRLPIAQAVLLAFLLMNLEARPLWAAGREACTAFNEVDQDPAAVRASDTNPQSFRRQVNYYNLGLREARCVIDAAKHPADQSRFQQGIYFMTPEMEALDGSYNDRNQLVDGWIRLVGPLEFNNRFKTLVLGNPSPLTNPSGTQEGRVLIDARTHALGSVFGCSPSQPANSVILRNIVIHTNGIFKNQIFSNTASQRCLVDGNEVFVCAGDILDLNRAGQMGWCSANDDDDDGFTVGEGDCNDGDWHDYPGAPEICDGRDNDCDRIRDEDCREGCDHQVLLAQGRLIEECGRPGANVGACIALRLCERGDIWSRCEAAGPWQEICGDFRDNDCDGATDEADALDARTFYRDQDRDGFGNARDSRRACLPPNGYVGDNTDCDDTLATGGAINTNAAEACDGRDNNCDGAVDEGFNVGRACTLGNHSCQASGSVVCNAAGASECNARPRPPAGEVCDAVDNDCDGETDEGVKNACGGCGAVPREICGDGVDNDCKDGDAPCPPEKERDDDNDGFCEDADRDNHCEDGTLPGDCQDDLFAVNPAAAEVCGDGIDNNCDNLRDEGAPWFPDADGDGVGVGDGPKTACDQPNGFVDEKGDCDDANARMSPRLIEDCADALDNNCNGVANDGCEDVDRDDNDGDGYCEDIAQCDDGSTPGDCDDHDAARHPGAREILKDMVDQDCDGIDGDAQLTVTPVASRVNAGDATAFQVSVQFIGGYDQEITLKVPETGHATITADLSVNPVHRGNHISIMTLATQAATPVDLYTIEVMATSPEPIDLTGNAVLFVTHIACQADEIPEANCRDNADNDCDNLVDLADGDCGDSVDHDGDGFCTRPAGCADDKTEPGDCDDADDSISPAAQEMCDDGIDNDCNGFADEISCGETVPPVDGDSDLFPANFHGGSARISSCQLAAFGKGDPYSLIGLMITSFLIILAPRIARRKKRP